MQYILPCWCYCSWWANTYTRARKKREKGSKKSPGVLLFWYFEQKADLLFKKMKKVIR